MMICNHLTIRKYVALLAFLPVLLMTVGIAAFSLYEQSRQLEEDLSVRGRLVARQLAASSEYGVFSHNKQLLQSIAQGAFHQSDVSRVVILNANSESLIDERRGAENGQADGVHDGIATPFSSFSTLLEQREAVQSEHSLLVYEPIIATQVRLDSSEAGLSGQRVGSVIVELDQTHTRLMQWRLFWYTSTGVFFCLLLTLYVIYLGSRRITNPIRHLSQTIEEIGAGKLDTRMQMSSGIHELRVLTRGINEMAEKLQHERDHLEQRIHEATGKLRGMAFYDALTGLPNRRMLDDRMKQALAASKRHGSYGALMFLDLDNFKPLNDVYGHAVGDLLLAEVARRLLVCVREVDTVARLGGDEFVVMIPQVDEDKEESMRQAAIVAEKIRATLAEPYRLTLTRERQGRESLEHRCSSSIGVALFSHQDSKDEVLKRADMAMYQAKEAGRNLVRFHTPVAG